VKHFTTVFSLGTRQVTIVDSDKNEIKLVADGNDMVTTWRVVSMGSQAKFHRQFKSKFLQNVSHLPNNGVQKLKQLYPKLGVVR